MSMPKYCKIHNRPMVYYRDVTVHYNLGKKEISDTLEQLYYCEKCDSNLSKSGLESKIKKEAERIINENLKKAGVKETAKIRKIRIDHYSGR